MTKFLILLIGMKNSFCDVISEQQPYAVCRDSGNDFWAPEIASDPGLFSFILFLFPHVGFCGFLKRTLFLGTEFVSGAD